MLKRFIPRNKQGGPRALDLPADEKQRRLSLALDCHSCVFFLLQRAWRRPQSVRGGQRVSRRPDVPPDAVQAVKMCWVSRVLSAMRPGESPPAGHIAHPYRFCSHTLCPLTREFLGVWLIIATCYWSQAHARPLTATTYRLYRGPTRYHLFK